MNPDGDGPVPPGVVAPVATEEEQDFIIAARESRRVAEVDEALLALRSDPNGFFRCRRCGLPIKADRLHLVPWSRLCAGCARATDR